MLSELSAEARSAQSREVLRLGQCIDLPRGARTFFHLSPHLA